MKKIYKFILGLIGVFIGIFLISCTNINKEKVLNDIDSGNYQQAIEDMSDLSVFDKEQIQNKALAKVSDIVNQVKDGKLSYSDAVNQLNFIKRIVPKKYESSIDNAISEVEQIEKEKTGK
ncbi:MAG: hypothetical protein ACRC57_03045 [Sarcina sp.]